MGNRIVMIGGGGLARAAVAALTHMFSRQEITFLADRPTGLVSDVYNNFTLNLNELRDVHGSLKPQQITHGPQRKGRGGKIKRW